MAAKSPPIPRWLRPGRPGRVFGDHALDGVSPVDQAHKDTRHQAHRDGGDPRASEYRSEWQDWTETELRNAWGDR